LSVRRGEIVLLDYPYTSGDSKVRPALAVQQDLPLAREAVDAAFSPWQRPIRATEYYWEPRKRAAEPWA